MARLEIAFTAAFPPATFPPAKKKKYGSKEEDD
jgi:hypothetical protein